MTSTVWFCANWLTARQQINGIQGGPGGERTAYQSGRTDEFGRYSFVPAAEGEWRVEVRDDEGHRAEAVIPITAEFVGGEREESAVLTESSLPQGADLFVRALLGVSLIFNIAAFVRLSRSRPARLRLSWARPWSESGLPRRIPGCLIGLCHISRRDSGGRTRRIRRGREAGSI